MPLLGQSSSCETAPASWRFLNTRCGPDLPGVTQQCLAYSLLLSPYSFALTLLRFMPAGQHLS